MQWGGLGRTESCEALGSLKTNQSDKKTAWLNSKRFYVFRLPHNRVASIHIAGLARRGSRLNSRIVRQRG